MIASAPSSNSHLPSANDQLEFDYLLPPSLKYLRPDQLASILGVGIRHIQRLCDAGSFGVDLRLPGGKHSFLRIPRPRVIAHLQRRGNGCLLTVTEISTRLGKSADDVMSLVRRNQLRIVAKELVDEVGRPLITNESLVEFLAEERATDGTRKNTDGKAVRQREDQL